jgi:hypothetical protein
VQRLDFQRLLFQLLFLTTNQNEEITMNATESQNALAAKPDNATITMGFGSLASFEFMQRTAKMFTHSSMVPTAYRATIEKKVYGQDPSVTENPSALPNCIIALNMSQRMNADPLMIMQNLHVIEGRPSWSSQFIIAAINSCGRYSPLRFDIKPGVEIDATCTTFEWENNKKKAIVTKTRVKNTTCTAWAVELATNTRLESPAVSMEMAVNEGWYGKNGSKWVTMPDLMLRYRSAAFFGRIYAPELLMGLPSAEETNDIITVTEQADGSYAADPTPTAAPARATASGAEDAEVKAPYSDEEFTKNLPTWQKVMRAGRKTADQIITMAQTKHPLTDAQIKAIHAAAAPIALRTGAPDSDGVIQPGKSFDEIMTMVCAATTEDALFVAGEWINTANDEEKAILNGKFDERLAELRVA